MFDFKILKDGEIPNNQYFVKLIYKQVDFKFLKVHFQKEFQLKIIENNNRITMKIILKRLQSQIKVLTQYFYDKRINYFLKMHF